jgi:hypothetical protein
MWNQENHQWRETKGAPKICFEVAYVFYCLLYWCIMHLLSICCSYCRTLEDVQTVIQHAKLFDSDLQPLTQVLSFAPRHEMQGKYRFLELDTTLLNSLHKGQRYLICVKMMLRS